MPAARTAGSMVGLAIVVDAAGAARDNNAPGVAQIFKRRLTRKYFRGDAQFADFASDEVTILTARVKYCDLRGRNYFFILSTMILWALVQQSLRLRHARSRQLPLQGPS